MTDFIFNKECGGRWLAYSKCGNNHIKKGLPNQDCCLFGTAGTASYMALADGVSSAPGALEGAAAAVQTVKKLAAVIDKGELDIHDISQIKRYVVQKWKDNFICAWDEYASTLNLAVRKGSKVLIGQIGDGIIIPDSDVSHIMTGEETEFYTSETYALGERVLAKSFRFELLEGDVKQGILMASDGIAKEIGEGSELGLRDYIHDLSKKDESIIKDELSNWFEVLDNKNGDDKSIAFWNTEV